MEALKILEKPAEITWDYDEEADVLYIAMGGPRPALRVEIGEAVVLRYDEAAKEMVGVTLIGLRELCWQVWEASTQRDDLARSIVLCTIVSTIYTFRH